MRYKGFYPIKQEGFDILMTPVNLSSEIPKTGYNWQTDEFLSAQIAREIPNAAYMNISTNIINCSTQQEVCLKVTDAIQKKHPKILVSDPICFYAASQKSLGLEELLGGSLRSLMHPDEELSRIVIPISMGSADKEQHGMALCFNADKENFHMDIVLLEQHATPSK